AGRLRHGWGASIQRPRADALGRHVRLPRVQRGHLGAAELAGSMPGRPSAARCVLQPRAPLLRGVVPARPRLAVGAERRRRPRRALGGARRRLRRGPGGGWLYQSAARLLCGRVGLESELRPGHGADGRGVPGPRAV
ncbi:unnamed protein product, partial [Effrenium voratum]